MENIQTSINRKATKYIFTTGGVLSSLGKGISSATLGLLLKQRGYDVTIMKLDPYINVDPGTMNPFQHGEVYVTDDGSETDLDLGHYERFLSISLGKNNNTTTGQVYYEVISKERNGQYLGKTVQVIPHITDEIKRRISLFDGDYDFVIIEIGGTVGDIESLPFLESARQLVHERGSSNVLNLHLTYVPYIHSTSELKTKPSQHSVKTLMEHGIRPDILLCRTEHHLGKEERSKIAMFCNVDEESVIEAMDVETTIYEVPLLYAHSGLDQIVLKKMNMPQNKLDLSTWTNFVNNIKFPKDEVTIGLIGKYTKYRDSYKSILESLVHAGSINNTRVHVEMRNSEEITEDNVEEYLADLDGVLVGPGFGTRGSEGKIAAIKYVRERNIPFFGICLGLQCAVIEYARNVCNLNDANSTEFNKATEFNVIDLMDNQRNVKDKGGTMRWEPIHAILRKVPYQKLLMEQKPSLSVIGTVMRSTTNTGKILEQNGMMMSGISPDGKLVEMIELANHPWFVGVQFHPELKSRAVTGHPLFISFINAVLKNKKNNL